MFYCCSDIHGCYEKYLALLKRIGFSDDDTLFVLGDAIDRGTDSIALLKDMMLRPNVIPIMGNHEYMALQVLRGLMKEITDDSIVGFEETLQMMLLWQKEGGDQTLSAFQKLSRDEQYAIVEYLLEFSYYEEICVNGNDFVLVHAGLDHFDEKRLLEDYALHELIFNRLDYDRTYFKDRYLVSGHTPTRLIHGKDEVYQEHHHIAIDCGCVFGGKLAAVCLDTLELYYV